MTARLTAARVGRAGVVAAVLRTGARRGLAALAGAVLAAVALAGAVLAAVALAGAVLAAVALAGAALEQPWPGWPWRRPSHHGAGAGAGVVLTATLRAGVGRVVARLTAGRAGAPTFSTAATAASPAFWALSAAPATTVSALWTTRPHACGRSSRCASPRYGSRGPRT